MTTCWYCGSKMIWENDYNAEDVGYEDKGIVSFLSCSNPDCGATAEFRIIEEGEDENANNQN